MMHYQAKVLSKVFKVAMVLLLLSFCLPLPGHSETRDSLDRLLQEPEQELGALEEKVDRLIQELEDEDWWVQAEAAAALGKIKDRRAVEPLSAALGVVPEEAAWALRRIGARAVASALATALRDGRRGTRSFIAEDLPEDVPYDFIDILRGDIVISETNIFIKLKLANIPPQLLFNRNSLEVNRAEYGWGLFIDIDGDISTGAPHKLEGKMIGGFEYSIGIMSFKGGDAQRYTSLIDGTQHDIWAWDGDSWTVEDFIYADVDYDTNTLIMIAPSNLPISQASKFHFITYHDDGTSVVRDFANVSDIVQPKLGPEVPSVPTNLVATEKGGQVILIWDDNSDNELGFRIHRSARGTITEIGRVAADVRTFIDANVTPGQVYQYTVVAFNRVGDSRPAVSNRVNIPPLPGPPSNLWVEGRGLGPGGLHYVLFWDDTPNEVGFLIQRKTIMLTQERFGVDTRPEAGRFVDVDRVGPNVQTYTDVIPVGPYIVIMYRVAAISADGRLFWSNVAKPVTIARPTGLQAEIIKAPLRVRLTWDDNSHNESGFRIYRRIRKGKGSWLEQPNDEWSLLAPVGADVQTFIDTNVKTGYTFRYSVVAFNGPVSSHWSDIATVYITLEADEPLTQRRWWGNF